MFSHLGTLIHPLGSNRATVSIPLIYIAFQSHYFCITSSSTNCTAGHSNDLYDCPVFFSSHWILFLIDARRLIRGSGWSPFQKTQYELSLYSLMGRCFSCQIIMPLNKFTTAILHGCLILLSTSAHRLCTSCIPLNDLLAEAYGIEISMSGL